MSQPPIVGMTAGDVAGIGPEVIVRALSDESLRTISRPLVFCHPDLLRRVAELHQISVPDFTELPVRLRSRTELEQLCSELPSGTVPCVNPGQNSALEALPNQVSAEAGQAAYDYLNTAIDFALAGTVDAIATAPLNKAALSAAGHNFPGHTEILAHRCERREFAMMLHVPEARLADIRRLIRTSADEPHNASIGLSIAHVTLHTSIASVPNLLNQQAIEDCIRLMDGFLRRLNGTRQSVAVCGLNPHNGENGLFGDEEARIIEPAVRSFRSTEIDVTGPLPVDTLMRRAFAGEFDGVVVMYHDQGHIPVKLIGFDAAVNITLGLPFVRTSPTHGTAFDRAWNAASPADASGMCEAIRTAATLCKNPSTA